MSMNTEQQNGTHIDEIVSGIYRISTPVPPQAIPGGFTFNQYLIDDEEPGRALRVVTLESREGFRLEPLELAPGGVAVDRLELDLRPLVRAGEAQGQPDPGSDGEPSDVHPVVDAGHRAGQRVAHLEECPRHEGDETRQGHRGRP